MKKHAYARLLTESGKQITDVPWQEYPRPQLRRDSFLCLNGKWQFTAGDYHGEILVPFAPEAILSGVERRFPDGCELIYKRSFALPEGSMRSRAILHIGAADQYASVYVNGTEVGRHTGGYEPFSFDITGYLADGENALEVRVTDNLGAHVLPYGKQREDRGGMWYTPVSGIWQSVWLESVPDEYVKSIRIVTGDGFAEIYAEGAGDGTVSVITPDGTVTAPMTDGKATVKLAEPRMWSPEDPYLYRFTLTAGEDTVESYFALRTLEIKTVDGIARLCLNGKPYFMNGLLDQGYYSDGIYTPASPELYEFDITTMKSLGFNMLRKHIKIEPEQFYYDCDRLGMLVFQDMVNCGDYSFFRDTALPTVGIKRLDDRRLHRDPATREAFIREMEATVRRLGNHPSIVEWTIFNEGWGQFDSTAMYHRLRSIDDTRFIDSASGWFSGGDSDFVSEHVYFKRFIPKKTEKPLLLSEFGGYSCKVADHSFNLDKTFGYRFFTDMGEFEDALVKLYEDEIIPAVKVGLCATVYTQVSDVEDETNGLLTYDRAVLKVDPARMKAVAEKLCEELG